MLQLRLKVKSLLEIRGRVIQAPKTIPVAIGCEIDDGFFVTPSGKRKRVMVKYDYEPWEMRLQVQDVAEMTELSIYHVRLSDGEDSCLPHMKIEILEKDIERGVFELKCDTGYHVADRFFVFRVKVSSLGVEVLNN